MSKPFLCFYVGPSPMFREQEKFGSELALEYLAAEFTKTHNVFIAADECSENKQVNNIFYINSSDLPRWRFNIMIVSRYVGYFIEFDAAKIALQTYVWLHDVDFHNYWRGIALPNRGIPFVRNIDSQVKAYITLSPWHAQNIFDNYDLDKNKIRIIGNGLAPYKTLAVSNKIPGKFVWMSDPQRGLKQLIDFFPIILRIIPHARLEVFREVSTDLKQYCLQFPNITLRGHANNQQIMDCLSSAEYWFYPTSWHETYCISALEAQYAGCICIATNLAALSTTIADRGILLKQPIYSKEYWTEAAQAFKDLESNPKRKMIIIQKAQQWAYKQTWPHKAYEWRDTLM